MFALAVILEIPLEALPTKARKAKKILTKLYREYSTDPAGGLTRATILTLMEEFDTSLRTRFVAYRKIPIVSLFILDIIVTL